jgi:polyhydroxyalkanoate synthesis regulator phasin
MPNFGSIVQKAFYLGIGLASVASEKAGTSIGELRLQAQKLAEELVERGEMTAEEARKLVDELVQQAQKPEVQNTTTAAPPNEPRRIEILNDDDPETSSSSGADANDIDNMEQKIKAMQEELRRLQRN